MFTAQTPLTRHAINHREPLERAPRFYSGTTGKVETIHATDAPIRAPPRLSTPPPPPTVEDADDDEDNFDAKPKFRGDADQEHVLEDNKGYMNNMEQRFVLVSEPSKNESTGARDEPRAEPVEREGRPERRVDAEKRVDVDRRTDAGPKTPPRKTVAPSVTDAEALGAGAAAAAATATYTPERRRRPSVHRGKSPVDLPRIDTGMYGPRGEASYHSRSRSSAPSYDPDRRYQAPPSPERPRPAREEFLSPEVIKAGARNREQPYYHGNGRRAPRVERPSSSAGRRRDEAYYHPGYHETPGPRSRPESEHRSARTSRRDSPRRRDDPDDTNPENLSAFYPDLSRGGASPQRPRSRRYTNQQSGDESESSVRRSGRRPIVIQAEGRKKLAEDAQFAERRRPRSSTASSPRMNGHAGEARSGYRDGAPRGPRSPGTGQFEGAPPYPVDDIMPSQERPGYLEPEYWGAGSGLGSAARGSQGTMPMPIRIPPSGGPRDSNGGRTSRSWQHSPPKPRGTWQDPTPAPAPPNHAPEQRPDISVRRYFEDPRRLGLPAVPRCPRKEPVAGLTDWLTLPECENFTICPTCYGEVFAASPFRSAFKPLPWQSPETRYFCDFGTFPWYPVAWLMTLKVGMRDLRLFRDVSRIAAKQTDVGEHCPGSKKGLRMWRSVADPATGRAPADFSVCGECEMIVGLLLPSLRAAFVATGAEGYGVCSMFGGCDKASFLLYFDVLEAAADGAAAAGAPVDEGALAEGLSRVRPAPPCSRDRPVLDGKFFRAPWAPDVLVCPACYEDVACPMLGGSARAEALGLRAARFPVGACKFWEEGGRGDFVEGLREEGWR